MAVGGRSVGAPPLTVDGLVVEYGAKRAVDGLSFRVNPGEIYGLLGSNGAGKSSTIRTVVGLVRPSGGAVRVFGDDALADGTRVKARVGYVPESALLFDSLTPREFLEYVASVRALDGPTATDRAERYTRALQLDAEVDRPLATLSNGTRQKVLLVAAFLHQPDLLVLDEPFNNLDPRAVRIMKELLVRYVAQGGRGALFSTHTMEVAEQICSRVGILDRGVLRGEGALAALRVQAELGGGSLESIFLRLTSEEAAVDAAVRSLDGSGR